MPLAQQITVSESQFLVAIGMGSHVSDQRLYGLNEPGNGITSNPWFSLIILSQTALRMVLSYNITYQSQT